MMYFIKICNVTYIGVMKVSHHGLNVKKKKKNLPTFNANIRGANKASLKTANS